MSRENQHFRMWAGESKRIIITVTDNAGNPVDLFGASILWAMQQQVYNGTDSRIEKSTGEGIDITDPTGGVFTIALQPVDTKEAPTGYYVHEAEVKDAKGRVSVVTTGRVTVLPSITN